MNILAIGCHPDDVEIACAGTLAKCVKRGDKVTVCHVSSGNLGHVIIPPDELRVIRANEAKKAGSLAGIEVISAGFDDLEIYDNNKEARDKIVDVIRYANPDVIITHNPDDYMPDHTAVSRLVFDASFTATLPNYDYPRVFSDENTPPAKLVPIYYMDTLAGVNFNPTEFVDISEVIDL
ncbi:MAG: PIG-L family deacetylase [Clostridia bacterium]|nr:PIG-L family deacetylase [Clostridia bacterium]